MAVQSEEPAPEPPTPVAGGQEPIGGYVYQADEPDEQERALQALDQALLKLGKSLPDIVDMQARGVTLRELEAQAAVVLEQETSSTFITNVDSLPDSEAADTQDHGAYSDTSDMNDITHSDCDVDPNEGMEGYGPWNFWSFGDGHSDNESIPGEIHDRLPMAPPVSRTNHAWNAFFDDQSEEMKRRFGFKGSLITKLRAQFLELDDGSGSVTESELMFHIQESLERRSGPLNRDLSDLLQETVRRRHAEIDLGLHEGSVGQEEWIHFMMLRATSPSHVAAKHLNKRLRKALASDPGLLSRLQGAFEKVNPDGGSLRSNNWERAFSAAGVPMPDIEELENYGCLTYFEFVCHALGAKLEPVQLAMYDLSDGVVKWIPSMLLNGRKFEAIWHTGVRVFGREFWYGGGAFSSDPQQVPFGRPVRVVNLGNTMRTHQELSEFLQLDLLYTYNRANYDMLTQNCNSFSNEVVRFLLHGQQIPEEVRLQPEWVQDAALTQLLRPMLNERLGNFGRRRANLIRQCDDVTEEWRRRLKKSDLALFRANFIERPITVQIVSVLRGSGDCPPMADIAFFMPCGTSSATPAQGTWCEWRTVHRSNVPVSKLYPCFNDTQANVMILQVGLSTDSTVGAVLRRHVSQPLRPVCPRGHVLQDKPLHWFSESPVCSVCGSKVVGAKSGNFANAGKNARQRSCCEICSFECCVSCLELGFDFHGGGVFADILTPSLAKDLLDNLGWLRFKANSYFCKADCSGSGYLEADDLQKIANRLRAELGLPALSCSEVQSEMELCRQFGTTTQQVGSISKDLLEPEAFANFFSNTLTEAVAAGQDVVPFEPAVYKEIIGERAGITKNDDEFVVAL